MSAAEIKSVRVRFAPSPTGFLHIGGARTAIFNWLFAQKHNGKFLLRIEDTDAERSGQDMVEAIIEGLRWLNLDWDEEIVSQSRRLEVYKKHAHALVQSGKAYKCFCSKEELAAKRDEAAKKKQDYRYRNDRKCLSLTTGEVEELEVRNQPYVIRLKLPEQPVQFTDMIHGNITVHHKQLDDFIIMRPDGYPTYHLAVVVDDYDMQISHVIRGDDHLSNTPKHILLYKAFGWQPPQFAHVPLILGMDKHRLSKRHGATAIGEYETSGYLAETVLNFLTLLGWSSGDDREIFSRAELVKEFDISGVAKKSAVFDEKKLEWMNGQYIMALTDQELLEKATPYLKKQDWITEEILADQKFVLKITAMLKQRLKRLTEFPEMIAYFFSAPERYEEKAVKKFWKDESVIDILQKISSQLAAIKDFENTSIEAVLRSITDELELGFGKVMNPLRLALTGGSVSPSMFEVMELLGKQNVLERIETACVYIRKNLVEN